MTEMRHIVLIAAAAAGLIRAQTPMLSFTATTDNVSGANDSIRIDVFRWSTDAERDQWLSAWTSPATSTTGARGGRGGRGGRGRGVAGGAAPDSPALEE